MQKVGIVFIVPDHRGRPTMATNIAEQNVTNPESIEVLAIFKSLQLCLHQGIPRLIIESDCLLLMEEIQSQDSPNSILNNILLDIKDLMYHLIECQIQNLNRSCNMAAHTLARNAWHVSDIVLWYEEMPHFLDQTIWFNTLYV